jgi:RNase P subunit RPR2
MAFSTSPTVFRRSTGSSPTASAPVEWRCLECNKLLGVRHGAQLHIRLQGNSYLVSLPVEAACRGCGAVNRT